MIRLATLNDLPEILEIYDYARQFMRAQGNPTQWGDSHPEKEILEYDINNGNLFVIENSAHDVDSKLAENSTHCAPSRSGSIDGVFAFIIGEDSTYYIIDNGQWASNDTYGTIHRVASAKGASGIVTATIDYCKTMHPYIRIDTHEKNLVMQHLIEKSGFKKSGIIYAYDGSPRLAYELLP